MAKSRLSTAEIRQRIRKRMPGAQGEEIIKALDGIDADMVKVKTWGDATTTALNNLAGALNTLATKLNADAGVTDTNYVNTNPTSNANPDI